jgi:hypothetical protein
MNQAEQCYGTFVYNSNIFIDGTPFCSEDLDKPKFIRYGDARTSCNIDLYRWYEKNSENSLNLKNKTLFSKGTTVYALENALFIPGSADIFLKINGNYLIFDKTYHTRHALKWVLERNLGSGLPRYLEVVANKDDGYNIVKECAFVINTKWAGSNYYHWLHECLPRLIRLKRQELLDPLQLFWVDTTPPKSFHIQHLAMLGININDLNIIVQDRPVLFKNLLYCSFLERGSISRHDVCYDNLLTNQCSMSASNNNKFSRIFIKRDGSQARSIVNCDELEKSLTRRNFLIVRLESLDSYEQIQLFKSAKLVVGPHGAGFANILFTKGANIVEIMPSDSFNPLYYMLSTQIYDSRQISCNRYYIMPNRVENRFQQMNVDIQLLNDYIDMAETGA